MTDAGSNERLSTQAKTGASKHHAWYHRLMFWKSWPQPIRMIVGTTIGGLLIVLGIIQLFTPGQGVLTILAGLAVLGTEYHWARRLLNWCHRQWDHWKAKLCTSRKPAPLPDTRPSDESSG